MRWALIVLAAFAAMASGAGATPTAASSCADGGTTTKTGSGYRIDYCGPAVATLRIGKKSYVFRDGSCFDADGNGTFMFSGTEIINGGDIENAVNGSGPFIWIAAGKQGSVIVAYEGPHALVAFDGPKNAAVGTPNTIATTSTGGSGRFTGKSKFPTKPVLSKLTFGFSGTWSCNGPVHSWADYIANVNRPEGG